MRGRTTRLGWTTGASVLAAAILIPAPSAATDVNVNIGALPAGKSVTVSFQAAVANPFPAGADQVSNQGTVTGANFASFMTDDPDVGGTADPTVTPIVAAPDLAIAKGDGGATAMPGQVVTYTLDYQNLGNQDASGVVITETVPTHTTFDETASGGPGVWTGCSDGDPAGTVCTHTAGAVGGAGGVGSNGSVNFGVEIDDPVADGATVLSNTATIADDGLGGETVLANNTDTVETGGEADLVITKSDMLDPIVAGRIQQYTLSVENTGPFGATSVDLVDTLPAGVEFISAGPSSASCSEAAGVVTCGLGDMASADLVKLSIDVLVDHAVSGSISNMANVGATPDNDPDLLDNDVTEPTEVESVKKILRLPDLFDADGIDEVAVVSAGSVDIHTVAPGTGAVSSAQIDPDFIPVDIALTSDVSGDGTPELAVLARNDLTGAASIFIYDLVLGALDSTVTLDPVFQPLAMAGMPTFGGSAEDELAVLGRTASGINRVSVRDAGTGAELNLVAFGSTLTPVGLQSVPSFGGTGANELAVVLRGDTEVTRIWTKDASDGSLQGLVPLSSVLMPLDSEVLPDLNTDSTPEYAILARRGPNGGTRVQVVEADNGTLLANPVVTTATAVPVALDQIADFGDTTAPEVAVLAKILSNDAVRVRYNDASSGSMVGQISFGAVMDPFELAFLDNYGDTAAAEACVVGRRMDGNPVFDGQIMVQVRDGASGSSLAIAHVP